MADPVNRPTALRVAKQTAEMAERWEGIAKGQALPPREFQKQVAGDMAKLSLMVCGLGRALLS